MPGGGGGQNTGKTQVINYCFFGDRNKPITLLYLGIYIIYWLKFDVRPCGGNMD